LKARHILLATGGSKDAKVIEAKRKTADSLLKIVNKDNFVALSDKFSDDTQSKKTGGVIDNFLEGDMVPEFGSFCATAPLNKFAVVKTEFGFHIVEVMERDASKFPVLASISKQFKASEETISNKESEINNILYKLDRKIGKTADILKKVSLFDTIVRQANYVARSILLEDKAPKAYGFATSMAADKILELAYSEGVEVGSLTTYPIKDKDKYIIGMVTSIKEEGEPTYENVKLDMERELITEKKAKRFMNQMAKGNTVKAVAKKCNLVIQTAEITFANPQIANVGYEPEIIGMLFSSVMKTGKNTLPLKGKSGVYMIQITKTTKAPASTGYKVERDEMAKTLKGSFQGQAIGALRKTAAVVDNRKLNELRLRM
jgi:peptidyl-prolyl cis-trans isomerase D